MSVRAFKETNQTMPKLYKNSFDYFRIFAAVQVLLGHIVLLYNINLSKPIYVLLNMFEGVPILFTLCGFLVTASYEKSDNDKEYFRKRVFRIFPPLWVSVIVGFIILWIFMGKAFPIGKAALWTVFQGFALQYTPGFAEFFGSGTFNGALWALFSEFQFYLLLPIFYKIFKKRSFRTWIITGVVLISLSVVISHIVTGMENRAISLLWKRCILSHIVYFYCGSFLYRFRDKLVPALKKWFPCILGVYVISYIINIYIGCGALYYIFVYCLLPFVIICGGYWFGEHRLKIDISYGIYLYHVMVINIFLQLRFEFNMFVFLSIIIISLLCGIASVYVDKLFRLISKKRSK